ncbi:MAG: hypothetical protein LBQ22_02340 [Bacteroidales bacterium]|jgi:hypothetical protein|nr:hypothetical protein [Bacteroidales bacterium]
MVKTSNIKYYEYPEIDFEKWNKVIDEADNALIYAHTCYLDVVSENWGAYVYGDYEYIMPLTESKKVGINFLQQPFYCQQLGIFPTPSEHVAREFIDSVRSDFKYVSINFNSNNKVVNTADIDITPVNNLVLDLNQSYEDICRTYTKHTVRHLKKAYCNQLHFVEYIKGVTYIDYKIKNQSSHIYKKSLKILKKMLPELLSRDKGFISAVFDADNNMCAAAVFVVGCGRVVYINGVTNGKGKENDAMYYLMDHVIKKFAGSPLLLDFEGSKIPGVARFFEGFGAKPEQYYNFKYNKLPIPLRWIKK